MLIVALCCVFWISFNMFWLLYQKTGATVSVAARESLLAGLCCTFLFYYFT